MTLTLTWAIRRLKVDLKYDAPSDQAGTCPHAEAADRLHHLLLARRYRVSRHILRFHQGAWRFLFELCERGATKPVVFLPQISFSFACAICVLKCRSEDPTLQENSYCRIRLILQCPSKHRLGLSCGYYLRIYWYD